MRTFGVDWYHHLPLHVKGILETLQGAGFEAYLAGGAVRDLWLGLPPHDFDIASSATPEEIERLFPRTEGVGRQFGIMIVVCPEESVEVARFRADAEYKDGRHPESVSFSSPEEDAKRRDFTINALFYDTRRRELIDYVGGLEDIEARLIRCVGDPLQRFEEDSLRMLRAVRFHAQLSSRGFRLHESVLEAIRPRAGRLALVSRERVTQEMGKILLSAKPSLGLRDLVESHLWDPVFGCPVPEELDRFNSLAPAFEQAFGEPASLALLVAAAARWLPGWQAESGFVLTKEAKAAVREVPQTCQELSSYASLSLAGKKSLAASRFFPHAWALLRVEGAPYLEAAYDDRKRWNQEGKIDPPPLLKGADILQAGVPPGPRVRDLLGALRLAQLNEEIQDHEAALAWLKQALLK